MLRRFPVALKIYDRVLDIGPKDPNTIAFEARIYQAEGNLEQAGKLLAGVNAQTPSFQVYITKMNQLFLERQFDEAIRLIHNRPTEFGDLSPWARLLNPSLLWHAQEYAGDIVEARATAQQTLGPLETLCQKDPASVAAGVLVLQSRFSRALLEQISGRKRVGRYFRVETRRIGFRARVRIQGP